MNEIPVGTVCPFAGQVNPVTGNQNNIWANLPCSGKGPTPGKLADGAPLNHLESQGWMLCDGRSLIVSSYPELYDVLGTLYGEDGSGATRTFRIPDYRGLFLRGFDAGAGLDPDAADRTAPTGGNVNNVVGSLQCDALQHHTHNCDITQPSGVSAQGQAAGTNISSKPTTSPNSPARVAPETRPKNVAVNYIIKYR